MKFRQLSRVVYASAPTREGRPSLQQSLRRLIDMAVRDKLILAAPGLVYVVGFGLRFDLAAVSDFPELKTQVDSVSGKVATIGSRVQMEYPETLVLGDGMRMTLIDLHFIDVATHVPQGTALRHIGQLLDLPKLEIPHPYSIERMDEYLRGDRAGFEAYALRDAEIAVRYAMRIAHFAKRQLGITPLPPTASALALRWCLTTLEKASIDRRASFGLHRTSTEAFHAPTKRRRTLTRVEPTPMRAIQEEFLSRCYLGGRNECYYLGPSPVSHWYDFDLAGAYSTGLVDLPVIDFEHPRSSLVLEDYLGHVAGYALVEFEHPADTRFPVFAVRGSDSKGLIFPLKGEAYATAPELRVAHDLGCRITIKWGVVYPWRWLPDDPGLDGVPTARLFGPFVKEARQLRARLKHAAGGQDSLEEQAVKLYANSVYGKTAQALHPKNVFDTRQVASKRLPPSAITQPAIAAHVTGFVRAILAEILNRIPRHRTVLSCTTDGFLTDAPAEELDLSGPLCERFQRLCDKIVPGSNMLEVKHEVAQVVCMRTRGQLTGQALPGKRIVLAKAGVQPLVAASPGLDGEAYKRMQNEAMVDCYLERSPGQKASVRQFASLRDQWEKGVDLFKYEKLVTLSLEPDMKRELIDPHMVDIAGGPRSHLAMGSRPWTSVEEFAGARARLDAWRQAHCLKTMEDWVSLEAALLYDRVRAKARAAGVRTMNLREGKGLDDVLRRAFLRAYAHQAVGLTRSMSYADLACWLTEIGYATSAAEARSARSQTLLLGSVSRTAGVMVLWTLLQAQFPEADLEQLLADVEDRR